MTEDLDAIDYLASQWSIEVDNAPTAGSLGLTSNAVAGAVPMYPSEMVEKGLNILRMYEAELEKYPGDEDVDTGLVNHLYSLGFMHYRKITFAYGMAKEGKSSADGDKACGYLKRAYEIGSDPRSADLLGNIFQRVDFYATAIYWMKEAERGVEINPNLSQSGVKAKASRFNLQAESKINDPHISEVTWPTSRTPGLILEYQPAAPTPPAPSSPAVSVPSQPIKSSGGCVGVLAVLACLLVGLAVLANRGTSNGVVNQVASTPPSTSVMQGAGVVASDTGALTAPSFTSPENTNLSDAAQRLQGEHFPQTRAVCLQSADIQEWSYSGVRYALNEMYARHGYPFKVGPIRRQFQKFSWYHLDEGLTAANVESQFTPIERANQILLSGRREALVRAGQVIN